MKSRLDQIEYRLQFFFENTLFAFPWNSRHKLLARQLVQAVESSLVQNPDGRIIPASFYSISANPILVHDWQSDPNFLPGLGRTLFDSAQDVGISFESGPSFELIPDPSMPAGALHIATLASPQAIEETGVMPVTNGANQSPELQTNYAYLLINDDQAFYLNLPMVNIGRRQDNQLVIDDPRVSRNHALLRAVHGQYILCDLNSTGGTFVNGQRVTQQALRPGDVISLAGYTLIYGEDAGTNGQASNGDTTAFIPPPSRKK